MGVICSYDEQKRMRSSAAKYDVITEFPQHMTMSRRWILLGYMTIYSKQPKKLLYNELSGIFNFAMDYFLVFSILFVVNISPVYIKKILVDMTDGEVSLRHLSRISRMKCSYYYTIIITQN